MVRLHVGALMKQNLYLKNGTLLATGYNRVVHGERGDYIELEKEHFVQDLEYKFGFRNEVPDDIYYIWLYPKSDKDVKIYYQLKTVKYADYKIGKFYISPFLLKNFKDPEQLFIYA